jgi:ribosomal protein S18 acetylase RimI-like enzyme
LATGERIVERTRFSGTTTAARYNGRVPFAIRQFAKADFETLWRIDQECFDPQLAYSRPELAFYMRRPLAFTLVAESIGASGDGSAAEPNPKPDGPTRNGSNRNGVLGFIVAERQKKKGHIITIDVIEPARRLGVGSALLGAAEEQLLKSGATEVELETAVDNEAAIRFYKRKGYFVERTVPGYYSNHLDALVMAKGLAPSVSDSGTIPR